MSWNFHDKKNNLNNTVFNILHGEKKSLFSLKTLLNCIFMTGFFSKQAYF